jgi:hypothetical protein
MRTKTILILLAVLGIASSYVTNPNGAEFTKFVQELTKKYEAKTQSRKVGITRDLEEVSLTARILRTVGKEKTFSSVCSEAWMLCNSNTCTAEELYHALSIHESLQCKTDTTVHQLSDSDSRGPI